LIMREGTVAPTAGRIKNQSPRWLALTLVLVVLRALPGLAYPVGRDQATFCMIAQSLLHGQQLYRDLWDNKPPGIFWLFALLVKVCGPVMWSVGVLNILWLVAISYCISRFTGRYLSTTAAITAVVVNASWHLEEGFYNAAQVETFLVLFVFASYFLMASAGVWRYARRFGAGVLFAAAFWLKYNALAFLPLVLAVPYLDFSPLDAKPRRVSLSISWHQWFRELAAFVAGFVPAVAVVLVYFWWQGVWPALKEVQFQVLPRYEAIMLERTSLGINCLRLLVSTCLFLGGSMAVSVAAVVVARRRGELARIAPAVVASGLAYSSTVAQVRLISYMFEACWPFFAVLWGYVGVALYQSFRRELKERESHGWRHVRLDVWVLLAALFCWPLAKEIRGALRDFRNLAAWRHDANTFYASPALAKHLAYTPEQMLVIDSIRKDTAASDHVFVWGCEPLIYFLSQRTIVSRFPCNYPLISPWGPPAWREELLSDLEHSPPRIVVVARDDEVPQITYQTLDSERFLQMFPELHAFIIDHYHLADNFVHFSVYVRRDISQLTNKVATSHDSCPRGPRSRMQSWPER
jgi:hypothetical protein